MRNELGEGTWIDSEEMAYPAGSLKQSRRHFAARCPDGKIRRGVCGIPDAYFSIPARMKANGKTISGYLSTVYGTATFNPTGKNRDAFGKAVE